MAMTPDKMGGMERLLSLNEKLEALLGEVNSVDILFNGSPVLKNNITDEDLDSVTAYSGISQADVQDNAYAIGVLKTDLQNAFVSIVKLSRRSRT
jgi:hypothetical protein